jgi:uncharacterized BrkB/YihY/UPF0761 family membrane protein
MTLMRRSCVKTVYRTVIILVCSPHQDSNSCWQSIPRKLEVRVELSGILLLLHLLLLLLLLLPSSSSNFSLSSSYFSLSSSSSPPTPLLLLLLLLLILLLILLLLLLLLGGFWPALRFHSTVFYLYTSLSNFSLSSSLNPLPLD